MNHAVRIVASSVGSSLRKSRPGQAFFSHVPADALVRRQTPQHAKKSASARDCRTNHFMPMKMVLSRQHSSSVHVEDFASDETRVLRTQKQHRAGNLFGLTDAAEGNRAQNLRAALRILERIGAHVGVDPSRSRNGKLRLVARWWN